MRRNADRSAGTSRRTFLVGVLGAAAATALAGIRGIGPARSAPTAGPALSLLSDFTACLPPSQVTQKCAAAGSLTLYWFPGVAQSGNLSTRIYVDDALVATTAGALRTLTGLTISRPISVRLTSVDTSTGVESESTAQLLRSVAAADSASTSRLQWLSAENTFGGAQLRWPKPTTAPSSFVVVDADSGRELVTVDGGETSALVTGLSTTQPTRLRLEGRGGPQTITPQNSVVVLPYTRVVPTDRSSPAAPTITVTALNRGIRISVSQPGAAGVAGWNVFSSGKFLGQVRTSPAEISGMTAGNPKTITAVAVSTWGYSSPLSNGVRVTPSGSGTRASETPTTPFRVGTDGTILDPSGSTFIPHGANVNGSDFIWSERTTGMQAAARDAWMWSALRLNCGMRDGGALSGGYLYFTNNQVDAIVSGYTAAGIVVMIDQHSHLGGGAGQNLPTVAGSAGDPTGRSAEEAITDWWVAVADRYRTNPRAWFNLVNEPGTDRSALEAQYRRMLARIRAIAPTSVVVLDAAAFANDIPTNTTMGSGPVDPALSFVLSNGPALMDDFGPAAGYGPIVFSIHFYARWTVNWGPGGMITDDQLATRLRDYIQRCKAAGLPLLVGELGVEAYARTADSACVRVALYEKGTVGGQTTGVLREQGIGFFPWHASTLSGMPITADRTLWSSVTGRSDTSPMPDTGNGLWDATH
ncbi:cellulase family glycosylhydrolase [uncultured Williamsia sp.]|uniref:cellulase family glycosylhydrolase n=1 Tax=uncultured Williamsia sp. TaxID=259311 RepID=UPI00262EA392|nr:cellulase family glycosylhydrolase [uncultured Williamsia sp.]